MFAKARSGMHLLFLRHNGRVSIDRHGLWLTKTPLATRRSTTNTVTRRIVLHWFGAVPVLDEVLLPG